MTRGPMEKSHLSPSRQTWSAPRLCHQTFVTAEAVAHFKPQAGVGRHHILGEGAHLDRALDPADVRADVLVLAAGLEGGGRSERETILLVDADTEAVVGRLEAGSSRRYGRSRPPPAAPNWFLSAPIYSGWLWAPSPTRTRVGTSCANAACSGKQRAAPSSR